MFKTKNLKTANSYISEFGYILKDISGRDLFNGFVINTVDKEVLKIKQSLYYYLNCDDKD